MKHPDYFQVLVAMDQLINTLFWGYADETISSRCYRHYLKGERVWAYKLVNAIFFWQDDHCKEAYESELTRAQLSPSMRV